MTATVFDRESVLPDEDLTEREKRLLGFDDRYARVHDQLQLLLSTTDLPQWAKKHHGKQLRLIELVGEQYPLVIFHGDVGTGKSATAECVANRLVRESGTEDSMLFTLGNGVRGSGLVGEMGTGLIGAFNQIRDSIGKHRRAVLIIDEADSLATTRTEEHSHHEDKVAVNTLIQCVDGLRQYKGRIVVILCTNRLSILDPALRRRASIIEKFDRPNDTERSAMFVSDLEGLEYSNMQLEALVRATGASKNTPGYTYSDVRTRLYPAALSRAFPKEALQFEHILAVAKQLPASPTLED